MTHVQPRSPLDPVPADADLPPLPGAPYTTVLDCSELLGVSKMAVYRLVNEGKLGDVRDIGRGLRISVASFEAFLHESVIPGCAPVGSPLAQRYVSVTVVAKVLGVSVMTAYRLVNGGAFAGALRIGRAMRVPYGSIQDYVRTSIHVPGHRA
jgi:excisionase family DNA binding protein